jgi:Flp pilus assembly protein TadD
LRRFIALAALATFALACDSTGTPHDTATTGEAEWVGRQVCATCHQDEHDTWRGSHHDLAMQEATEATVLGDFGGSTFEYAGVTSTFYRRDGKFLVETDGPDGSLTEYEIAYTFGVDPLQQYLIRFPDGRVQSLGICWDSRPAEDGGQRWFHVYPDESVTHDDILHWTGPLQNWNFMCAECHSTRVRKNYDPATDRFDTTWNEIDVSCEACHGPGSGHVQAARNRGDGFLEDTGLLVDLSDDARWVMDMETGNSVREPQRSSHAEIETCARCHARRAMFSEDYVHGRALADTHRPALLTEQLYFADGQIDDEVYVYGSFLQSKMHASGVSCGDCHEPHSLELLAPGNILCGTCHLATRFDSPEHHRHEAGTEAAECVSCHMPSRNYMVVDPRRDHSFRVPRPDLTVEIGTPNACGDCHGDRSAEWAAERVAEWYGPERSSEAHYGQTIAAARRGDAGATEALIALADDRDRPDIVRATAVSLLSENPGEGMPAAVERATRDADPLVRMAAADVAGLADEAYRLRVLWPLLSDPVAAVRLEAAASLASVPVDDLSPDRRATLSAAIEEYVASLELNADRAESHMNLGLLQAGAGRVDEAEAAYRRAMAKLPGLVGPYVNLADLFRLVDREAEAEAVLRDGLTVNPDSADLRHALGLALVRQKRYGEGVAELREAVRNAPDDPRYAYVLGVALHSTGQGDEAIRVLEEAHERRPGSRDLLVALATISRDRGDRDGAVGYARKLAALDPGDPTAAALLQQLDR